MSYHYATLAQIKANINTGKSTEDVRLLEYAAYVSVRIDRELHRELPFFLPYREARPLLVDSRRINSRLNTFSLGDYLLELDSASLNGTTLTDAAAYPSIASPITVLRRTTDGWYGGCVASGELPELTVSGVWGYHGRGTPRWKQIGTLAANIDADDTTITVTNNTAQAVSGENTPDFSAGCLFRIGSEYLFKTYSASGVAVERGVHGTTAAAHTLGDAVEVWQVEAPIARVVARQSGLLLARRGAYDTRSANDMGGAIVYPQDLLRELLGVLQTYSHL
jgi:hypothetical protein